MNQQGMKAENKQKIYRAISEVPGISRVNIAKQCKFSKTTVSILVDELIQEGYVVDGGLSLNQATGQGRKPSSLFLNKKAHCLIVVNWHKRYIQICRADLSCSVKKVRTVVPDGEEDVQQFLAEQIREFIRTECGESHVMAVCMILPAMIDRVGGEVISAVLSEKQTYRVMERLSRELQEYSLVFFNDTACMAYAEKVYGSGNRRDDFVYINLNDGIGAAFVLGGGLLGGAGGMTTQFGHFSLGREGESCICGGHGCLETRVGEQALTQRIRECGAEASFEGCDPVLFRDVGARGAAGDAGALRVMDALAQDIGYALGNLITMLRVDRVVLGGLGRNLGEGFLQRVRQAVTGIGFQQFVQRSVIEYTTLDEDALFGGAARYYMDNYFAFSEQSERMVM